MNTYYRHLLFVLAATGIGGLFSGYLAYRNYFASGCSQGPLSAIVTCGGLQAIHIFGQPTCIYGFSMFAIIFLLTLVMLNRHASKAWASGIVALTLAGVLFAGFLSVDEMVIRHIPWLPIPACIIGFVCFATAAIFAVSARRQAQPRGLLFDHM